MSKAKFWKWNYGAGSTTNLPKVISILNTISGGNYWTYTTSSGIHTFSSEEKTICGLSSFSSIKAYSTNGYPNYAYYDEDNNVFILGCMGTSTSVNADSIEQLGMFCLIYNGMDYSKMYMSKNIVANMYNLTQANLDEYAILMPMFVKDISSLSTSSAGASYFAKTIQIPNLYVALNGWHISPSSKILDKSGKQYLAVAWNCYVDYDKVDIITDNDAVIVG